ncbi:MAG: peptidylprolyl isomerase, partial [Bacteroidaceae bacterium]|nr:peptidylprolyl isomerase [Bacteroidaceae bacterium]
MAEAARAEDLDKSEAFQQTLSSFKQELAGKYLFDEQSVARNADVAFDKLVATSGNKQLLIKQIFHALPQHVMNNELTKWQQRMDSISRAIASGADFEVLMNRYSETTTAVWMRRLDMTDEMEQV